MAPKAAAVFALKESRHSGMRADIIWRRRVAAVCALQESCSAITTFNVSKKTRAPIAMAAPVKMLLSVTADDVVDVRLLMLGLFEGNVDIRDMALVKRSYKYKRFSLCF